MPRFNSDITFVDASGQIRATQGDLTLRADTTNNRHIIVGNGISLRPEINIGLDLGQDFLRWNTLYADSGDFAGRVIIDQTDAENALNITNAGAGKSINIVQSTNNQGLSINKTDVGSASVLQIENAGVGNGLRINQAGNGGALVIVRSDPGGAADATQINNAGVANGLRINQTGDGVGIFVQQTGDSTAGFFNQVGLGICLSANQTFNNIGFRQSCVDPVYTSTAHQIEINRQSNTVYNFGRYFSASGTDPKFTFRGDGALFSDIAGTTPADYAEYFECDDPSGIEPGYAVELSTDDIIKVATSGASPLGIVSAKPAIVADSAWNYWHAKYLKDDFGGDQLDALGNQILNPAWSSGLLYTPREERPEWVTVGLLGKIWVRTHNEVILAGDHVYVGTEGMMMKTRSSQRRRNENWLVIASGLAYDPAKGYGTARIMYK